MAMQYDGKTYRNLMEQVGYLTRMYQDLGDRIEELRAQIPSKMIVEELPEEGDPLITYYVGPKGTEPNLYYEVWVWVQEEPDGPFVWRELEDTDQVDLSGYLPIQDGITTLPQVYGKTEAGDQVMVNMDIAATALTILFRDANGRTKVAAPSADGDAANKKYCDDGFVAKRTTATTYPQAYYKKSDGTQDTYNMSYNAVDGTIMLRSANGQVMLPNQTTYVPTDDQAVSKRFADGTYLAKQTGAGYFLAYTIETDGTQSTTRINQGSAEPNTLVYRTASGQVVCADPTSATHAATKAYVDAAVGQLLFLHDIEIIVTVDSTNKLYIKAYLINGSSTAITSFNRILYKRIDVQWGAYGQSIATAEPCSVSKLPDGFRNDEFDNPYIGFLYQYISGGSLVSGKTTNEMIVTATDSVITF